MAWTLAACARRPAKERFIADVRGTSRLELAARRLARGRRVDSKRKPRKKLVGGLGAHNGAMTQKPLELSALDAAIIDLDGTMVDTVGDFEQALARTLADLGLAPIDRAFITRTVGRGSMHLLTQTLAHAGGARELLAQAWTHYQRHYADVNGLHADVVPRRARGPGGDARARVAAGVRHEQAARVCTGAAAGQGAAAVVRACVRRRFVRTPEARSAAVAQDLRGPGHRCRRTS